MAGAPEGRFRSHRNYVEALTRIGGRPLMGMTDAKALKQVAKLYALSGTSDKRPAQVDHDQVQKSLRNAWSTELLLALPGQWTEEDEFIRLSNSWGVIQAYYVGYHSTQALIVAKGNPRPREHPPTRQWYASLWVDKPLQIAPWTFGVASDGWRNLPAGEKPVKVSSMSSCTNSNAWSLVAQVMRTTRQESVEEAWKRKRDSLHTERKREAAAKARARADAGKPPLAAKAIPRPNLDPAQKAASEKKVRTHTLLDYLWRLRIDANYDDAAVFIDGPENDYDSYILHRRLSFLASGMALLAELRVRDLVGASNLHQWADDFIAKSVPKPYDLGIKLRRSLL